MGTCEAMLVIRVPRSLLHEAELVIRVPGSVLHSNVSYPVVRLRLHNNETGHDQGNNNGTGHDQGNNNETGHDQGNNNGNLTDLA